MLAIINPAAGGRTALAKWNRVEPGLRASLGSFSTFVARSEAHLNSAIPRLLAEGHTEFIAGGGDGTVNVVLNALLDHVGAQALSQMAVGAVGLGSSNDFHKPFRSTIEGVPCRVDFEHLESHDIGLLTYQDARGEVATRHWFVNASIGISADANRRFNRPDRLLRFLKKTSTPCAIAYAALCALLSNRPRDLSLAVDDRLVSQEWTRNLGLVKNPHFAGSLHYDSPHEPDSGSFHVHYLGAVSMLDLVRALAGLAKGSFAGGKGARSWVARRMMVSDGARSFAVECDGEVLMTPKAQFSILPQRVRLCS